MKMYNHPYLDPDSGREALQQKVQFDIRFYFCHRGAENMETMKKTMFAVRCDKNGAEYVCKVEEEATKNHRETDQDILTAFMPENRDDKLCPVRSFKMYLSHLHLENDHMWQMPNYNLRDKSSNVWYTKSHLGKNKLGPFMKDISVKCQLSKIYTNHCIRVTGASILTRCNYSAKEIMSVTSHKSVQSLTIYQRVQDPKKIEMGNVLRTSLTTPDQLLPIARKMQDSMSTTMKAIEDAPTPSTVGKNQNQFEDQAKAIIPYEADFTQDNIPDFDLLTYISKMQHEELNANVPKGKETTKTLMSNTMNQHNSLMFAGCKIGNINITIHKA